MMENPQLEFFQQRLAEVQKDLRQRRAAACVHYEPSVLGFVLKPITFSSYGLLLAMNNAFAVGGAVGFHDIFQFIWVHRPEFGQYADRERMALLKKVNRAIHGRFPQLNAFANVFYPAALAARRSKIGLPFLPIAFFLGKIRRPPANENYLQAIGTIREIFDEALHDFPRGGDDSSPLPYAVRPQIISLLQRGYGLDFVSAGKLVDTLPLKELVQHLREVIHRLSGGKDKLLSSAEAKVWADYLAYKTAQVNERN